jgi:predicted ATPase
MITQFRLENFRGHRDTVLALPQFTVLVGDNSSGKTSVLEALRLLDQLVHANRAKIAFDEMIRHGAKYMKLSLEGQTHGDPWSISMVIEPPDPEYWHLSVDVVNAAGESHKQDAADWPGWRDWLRGMPGLTRGVRLYRFHSDQIAATAYSDQPDAAVAADGALTAVALAALKLADDDAFDRVETAMRRLVPSLQRMFLRPATLLHPSNPNPVTGSKLYFDFQGAKGVPAHHASQGTLVALALLTVLHGRERPSVILLDDFDHALHPRAQMELVRMINDMLALDDFGDTQIIATTHSPYVLDEVSPSNVIAFALRDDGTVASKPLSEHPDAPKSNGSLKAGELWSLDAERDWVR